MSMTSRRGDTGQPGAPDLEGRVALIDPGLVDRDHDGDARGHRLDAHSRAPGWHGFTAGPRG
jgi:hypothetical protein